MIFSFEQPPWSTLFSLCVCMSILFENFQISIPLFPRYRISHSLFLFQHLFAFLSVRKKTFFAFENKTAPIFLLFWTPCVHSNICHFYSLIPELVHFTGLEIWVPWMFWRTGVWIYRNTGIKIPSRSPSPVFESNWLFPRGKHRILHSKSHFRVYVVVFLSLSWHFNFQYIHFLIQFLCTHTCRSELFSASLEMGLNCVTSEVVFAFFLLKK